MTRHKAFLILIISAVFMYGCKSMKENKNIIPYSCDDVAYILVEDDTRRCADDNHLVYLNYGYNINFFPTLFEISEKKIIAELINELEEDTHGKANVTFSGTLPFVFFVDKNKNPLFYVSIICDDSSVSVYDCRQSDDTHYKMLFSGINRAYVKKYYEILREHAPETIKRLEEQWQGRNMTLKQVLFPSPSLTSPGEIELPNNNKWLTILQWENNAYILNGENYGSGDDGAKKVTNYLSKLPDFSSLLAVDCDYDKVFLHTKEESLNKKYDKRLLCAFVPDEPKIFVANVSSKDFSASPNQILFLGWRELYYLNGVECNSFNKVLELIKNSKGKKVLFTMNLLFPSEGKGENECHLSSDEVKQLINVLKEKDIKHLGKFRSLSPCIKSKSIPEHKLPPHILKKLEEVKITGIYPSISSVVAEINRLLKPHIAYAVLMSCQDKTLTFEADNVGIISAIVYICKKNKLTFTVENNNIILKEKIED